MAFPLAAAVVIPFILSNIGRFVVSALSFIGITYLTFGGSLFLDPYGNGILANSYLNAAIGVNPVVGQLMGLLHLHQILSVYTSALAARLVYLTATKLFTRSPSA